MNKALIRDGNAKTLFLTGFGHLQCQNTAICRVLDISSAKPSLFTGLWTSPGPKHCYFQGFCQSAAIYRVLIIPSAKPLLFTGFWTSPVPNHRYLQGFGHLQGQNTLHVDCTTNVHSGGAVHVVSYPDLII